MSREAVRFFDNGKSIALDRAKALVKPNGTMIAIGTFGGGGKASR
jgi:hypothetical protein